MSGGPGGFTREAREWAALRLAYRDSDFDRVVKRESPDFVLTRANWSFGVEVTELFNSESEARATERPEYIGDLLAGGRPLHKDDVAALPVSTATILSPEGEERERDVPAILMRLPTLQERAEMLRQVVAKKELKYSDYSIGLSHVNLIVVDRQDRTWASDHINVGELLTPGFRIDLLKTEFREVYFTTRTRDRLRFIVPLRMVALVAEMYMFGEALATYDTPEEFSSEDLVPRFVQFMRHTDFPVHLCRTGTAGDYAAHLGNSSVQVSPDRAVTILDHADLPTPSAIEPPNDSTAVTQDEFVEHHAAVLARGVFTTEIAYEPKADVHFW